MEIEAASVLKVLYSGKKLKNEQKHSVCVYKWQGFLTLPLLLSSCIQWVASNHFVFSRRDMRVSVMNVELVLSHYTLKG